MRFVIFAGGQAQLLIKDAKVDANGVPYAGNVVNGGWAWVWKNGELLAKAANGLIMNRHPMPEVHYLEVPIDSSRKIHESSNYADDMDWAQSMLAKSQKGIPQP